MNNQFTYLTRTGNKMRIYIKVAIWIFVLIAAIGAVAAVTHDQMVSKVMATPRPLYERLIPTETALAAMPAEPVESCSSDPSKWILSDNPVMLKSNLKLLAPQCVYDGLEKAAAWVYATTAMGYTRADAATALGLQQDTLIANPGNITVLTDFADQPQAVEVISAVNNAELAEWRVNEYGETGLEMSFSGCFVTSTLTGGQVVTWGNGYPVVCQFFADYRNQFLINNANGKLLTIETSKRVRRPIWFGYIGSGNWSWLGSSKVWDADLTQLPALPPTLNTTIMTQKYGLTALPLPQNWQSAVGQEFSDALLAELNSDQ